MDNQIKKIAVRGFASAFAAVVSESLGQAIGAPWPLEALDAQELPPRNSQPVQFRLKVDGGLRGDCFVEFYEPHASELASKLSPPVEGAVAEEPGKVLAAAISAAMGALTASLAP